MRREERPLISGTILTVARMMCSRGHPCFLRTNAQAGHAWMDERRVRGGPESLSTSQVHDLGRLGRRE